MRKAKQLTDIAIRQMLPGDKERKEYDRDGLYLLVKPNGSKLFRYDYSIGGKRKTYAIGIYPEVRLVDARARRDEIRKKVADGIDPIAEKRREKLIRLDGDTFEDVFNEWIAKKGATWSSDYTRDTFRLFERDLLPDLGKLKITDVDTRILLAVLQKIEKRGALYTVKRARERVGTLFRYALQTGRCTRDPSHDLHGAFVGHVEKHRAAIVNPDELRGLLQSIWNYSGTFVVKQAFRLTAMLALRPGEICRLEWAEVDFDAAEIRIPAEKMKMKNPHIVPLATQSIQILKETRELTGRGPYVFPSSRTPSGTRSMSNAAIISALHRMGYKGEMTAHGFRGTFCSLLNESGLFNPDAIERQLAHQESNKVRKAYLHTQYLAERRKMMQYWADYLDGLREGGPIRGANVVPFRVG